MSFFLKGIFDAIKIHMIINLSIGVQYVKAFTLSS